MALSTYRSNMGPVPESTKMDAYPPNLALLQSTKLALISIFKLQCERFRNIERLKSKFTELLPTAQDEFWSHHSGNCDSRTKATFSNNTTSYFV